MNGYAKSSLGGAGLGLAAAALTSPAEDEEEQKKRTPLQRIMRTLAYTLGGAGIGAGARGLYNRYVGRNDFDVGDVNVKGYNIENVNVRTPANVTDSEAQAIRTAANNMKDPNTRDNGNLQLLVNAGNKQLRAGTTYIEAGPDGHRRRLALESGGIPIEANYNKDDQSFGLNTHGAFVTVKDPDDPNDKGWGLSAEPGEDGSLPRLYLAPTPEMLVERAQRHLTEQQKEVAKREWSKFVARSSNDEALQEIYNIADAQNAFNSGDVEKAWGTVRTPISELVASRGYSGALELRNALRNKIATDGDPSGVLTRTENLLDSSIKKRWNVLGESAQEYATLPENLRSGEVDQILGDELFNSYLNRNAQKADVQEVPLSRRDVPKRRIEEYVEQVRQLDPADPDYTEKLRVLQADLASGLAAVRYSGLPEVQAVNHLTETIESTIGQDGKPNAITASLVSKEVGQSQAELLDGYYAGLLDQMGVDMDGVRAVFSDRENLRRLNLTSQQAQGLSDKDKINLVYNRFLVSRGSIPEGDPGALGLTDYERIVNRAIFVMRGRIPERETRMYQDALRKDRAAKQALALKLGTDSVALGR